MKKDIFYLKFFILKIYYRWN